VEGKREKKRYREEKMTKRRKKHISFFISFFFLSFLPLRNSQGMTPACGVASILLSHTPHTPILSGRELSWKSPPLCPWDTRTHNAYNHTASLFSLLVLVPGLPILERCSPGNHIGWEWLLMYISTGSAFLASCYQPGTTDNITLNGTCV
jgi:hypothetical protein